MYKDGKIKVEEIGKSNANTPVASKIRFTQATTFFVGLYKPAEPINKVQISPEKSIMDDPSQLPKNTKTKQKVKQNFH